MRGKDYNAGLRGVLFEARHHRRMGAAVWLYGWLVLRQTHQQGDLGWVLGGAPISYREIEEETGFNCRTLERWMQTLRRHGYIETEVAASGVIVRITKAKKFPQGGRNSAYWVRKVAEGVTQSRVPGAANPAWNHRGAAGIGSSSVAGSQERIIPAESRMNFHREAQNRNSQNAKPENHNPNPNPSGLGQTQNRHANAETDFTAGPHLQQQTKFILEARLRQQLIRAERDEAVRRELAVGSGPEVRRS
jgi:hypothetical protein